MPSDLQLALPLLAALLLSSVVGLERELSQASVGLRTHALVGFTTALLVVLADLTIQYFGAASPLMKFDPLAVLGATVSGVSFLGAGAIIASSTTERRQSLTSAASILGTASLGVTCGLQHYLLAVIVALIMLLILNGYRWIEVKLLETHAAENKESHQSVK